MAQATVDGMFEDLNAVLNNGDLPNLFGPEEMERIHFVCRRDCTALHLPPTRMNVYAQVSWAVGAVFTMLQFLRFADVTSACCGQYCSLMSIWQLFDDWAICDC